MPFPQLHPRPARQMHSLHPEHRQHCICTANYLPSYLPVCYFESYSVSGSRQLDWLPVPGAKLGHPSRYNLKTTMLPLLLFVLAWPASSSEPLLRTCEPIRVDMCLMWYNMTSMPNLGGNDIQQEADLQLKSFSPLIQYGCSQNLKLFLCSVYVPMCTEKVSNPIGPCRGLCEGVRSRCFPVLQGFGFPWPDALNCSRFPVTNNHEHMCIEGPKDEIDIRAPVDPAVQKFDCGPNNRKGCPSACDSDLMFDESEKKFAEVIRRVITLKATIFPLLLFVLAWLAYFSEPLLRTCEPICLEMSLMWYNMSSMPNLSSNDVQQEADLQLKSFSPLIQCGCSQNLKLFLRTVYVPISTEEWLSEGVRSRCFPVLQGFGFPWPDALNCSRFPVTNNHEYTCIEGPKDEIDIRAPVDPAVQKFDCGPNNRNGCPSVCDSDLMFDESEKFVEVIRRVITPKATIFPLLLFVLAWLAYFSEPLLRTCEPICLEMSLMWYMSSMPNLSSNDVQQEADLQLKSFSPLIQCGVRSRCFPVLQGFGFPWPDALNCSRFPVTNNHEYTCIEGPKDEIDIRAPVDPAVQKFDCGPNNRNGCPSVCDSDLMFDESEKFVEVIRRVITPKATIFPLLLFVLAWLAYFSEPLLRICEPICLEMSLMWYNMSSMPNLSSNDVQQEEDLQLKSFSPLIQCGCSQNLKLFLCSVYVPISTEEVSNSIGPCSVRSRCFPVLQGFGFPLPDALNCSRFPVTNNHEYTCIEGPKDEIDIRAPVYLSVQVFRG
nr:unnamed protein product [Callosobruchus analis]